MKKLIVIFLLLIVNSCSIEPKETILKNKIVLPELAPDIHQCMKPRWSNSLFDSEVEIPFNITVHHITGEVLDILLLDTEKTDSVLVETLNKYFKKVGFKFSIKESKIYSDKLLIKEFTKHSEQFKDRNTINIIIYHYREGNENLNGLVEAAPSISMGINLNVIAINTVAHEMGHIFGLPHIFEKDDTDGKNVMWGDQICDTPAFSLMDIRYITDCAWKGKPKYSNEELDVIIPNLLNYNNERECRDMFTGGQIMVMRWYVENTPVLQDAIQTNEEQ